MSLNAKQRNVERVKARYHENEEVRQKTKERASRWNRENRDKRRVIEHRMRDKNPAAYMLHSSRSNAKKRGQEHTISVDDIVVPTVCPVFKVPFEYGTPLAPSLDRIDSTKGYVPGNVQVISKKANTMKTNATKDELILFAQWVLNESW